jgi:hypothetical protein
VIGGFIVGVLENLLGAYVIGTELKLTVALVLIVARSPSAQRPVRQESGDPRMKPIDRKWVWIGGVAAAAGVAACCPSWSRTTGCSSSTW